MRHHWQKDYPTVPNLTEEQIDENSSLKKMLRLAGGSKKVIDFGCATGYLARLLRARGCEVTGLEINASAAKHAEEFCEQVIVADLDYVSLSEILPNQKFDVAIFGDVLEHLRNPWEVLEEVRSILTEEGYVVASIPNVAHGAVRLAMMQGKFQYEQLGLLDNTHLRFFTRQSVIDLFEQAGYTIETIDRTVMPIFDGNWVPKVRKEDFSPEVVQSIEQQEDSDTFQYIVRAFPLTEAGRFFALESKFYRLEEQYEQLQDELKQTKWELASRQPEVNQLQEQLHHAQEQLRQTQEDATQLYQQSQSQLEQVKAALQKTIAELEQARIQHEEVEFDREVLRFRAERFQAKLAKVRQRFKATQAQLQESRGRVEAMETSKFWKLRAKWFGLKHRLGLKGD
ncbi:methyltransferase domain-containing protein [Microcoleus sp. FACHB-1515]|uniref:class I SAM-dependent methyltransferase n=1 Tax=Cyanophyceae TaxID=3028117 RepID=UPI001682CC44|nr:class I SAM-dependent methyltransferase [Microcoleus sp. FACHB-1515]MBD2088489.1 methyltransferase domain-containing protein [Microcoleus sp. FACHB-1515]